MTLIDNYKRNSDTVFIIGGGPSLNQTLPDKSILDDYDVIAINSAYKFFPKARICHFMDNTWYQWNKEELPNFKNEVTVCCPPNDRLNYPGHYHKFNRGEDRGISKDVSKLFGNNAGHQAINLAYLLGYTYIVLIGFDMDITSKQTHWHNEHKRQSNVDRYESTMIPCMNTIPQFENTFGFKVLNLNPKSAIKCFEFTKLEDVL